MFDFKRNSSKKYMSLKKMYEFKPLDILDIVNLKKMSHSSRCGVDVIVAVIFISLTKNDFEHFSHVYLLVSIFQ